MVRRSPGGRSILVSVARSGRSARTPLVLAAAAPSALGRRAGEAVDEHGLLLPGVVEAEGAAELLEAVARERRRGASASPARLEDATASTSWSFTRRSATVSSNRSAAPTSSSRENCPRTSRLDGIRRSRVRLRRGLDNEIAEGRLIQAQASGEARRSSAGRFGRSSRDLASGRTVGSGSGQRINWIPSLPTICGEPRCRDQHGSENALEEPRLHDLEHGLLTDLEYLKAVPESVVTMNRGSSREVRRTEEPASPLPGVVGAATGHPRASCGTARPGAPDSRSGEPPPLRQSAPLRRRRQGGTPLEWTKQLDPSDPGRIR